MVKSRKQIDTIKAAGYSKENVASSDKGKGIDATGNSFAALDPPRKRKAKKKDVVEKSKCFEISKLGLEKASGIGDGSNLTNVAVNVEIEARKTKADISSGNYGGTIFDPKEIPTSTFEFQKFSTMPLSTTNQHSDIFSNLCQPSLKPTSPTSLPKKSFSSLFQTNRSIQLGLSLDCYEPQKRIIFEEADIKPVEDTWGLCLIGCFTGRFPGLKAVEGLTKKWGKQVTIIPHTNGWIVFKFENEEDRVAILKNGPYAIGPVSLLLKKPSPNFVFDPTEFLKVPLWVQVFDITPGLWHKRGLSKIASEIGSPICTDQVTAESKRFGFARFLVEIDATKRPLHFIEGTLPCGKELKLRVKYEHFPDFCCFCNTFGHNAFSCDIDANGNKISPLRPLDAAMRNQPCSWAGAPHRDKTKAPAPIVAASPPQPTLKPDTSVPPPQHEPAIVNPSIRSTAAANFSPSTSANSSSSPSSDHMPPLPTLGDLWTNVRNRKPKKESCRHPIALKPKVQTTKILGT